MLPPYEPHSRRLRRRTPRAAAGGAGPSGRLLAASPTAGQPPMVPGLAPSGGCRARGSAAGHSRRSGRRQAADRDLGPPAGLVAGRPLHVAAGVADAGLPGPRRTGNSVPAGRGDAGGRPARSAAGRHRRRAGASLAFGAIGPGARGPCRFGAAARPPQRGHLSRQRTRTDRGSRRPTPEISGQPGPPGFLPH